MLQQFAKNFKPLFYRILGSKFFPPLWLLQQNVSENIAITMMHGIHDRGMASKVKPPDNSIFVDDFRTNILLLNKSCHIISMDDAVDMLNGRLAWRPHCIVLTFDDSLKCLATIAAPLLSQMGLTATFYISTEVINTQKPYWWRRLEQVVRHAEITQAEIKLLSGEHLNFNARNPNDFLSRIKAKLKSVTLDDLEESIRSIEIQLGTDNAKVVPFDDPFAEILTWSDVRRLYDLGMTIGSHTVMHNNLALLSSEELRFELSESRHLIETMCRTSVKHLAYPFGFDSIAVREAARDCGYVSGVTTRTPGWNPKGMDLFQLRRFSMPHEPFKLPYVLRDLSMALRNVF